VLNNSIMKVQDIIRLMDFISRKKDLKEVNIETQEIKLSVKKVAGSDKLEGIPTMVQPQYISMPQAPVAQAAAPVAQAVEIAAAPVAQATAPAKADNYIAVKSPMIGTFYRSSNPETPAFVNVGDKIEKGQAICIIEAMKLFNEIESDISGTIVKVLVENAQPVEFDQPLFLVDPA